MLKKKNWFPFSGERAKVGIISEYIINLVPSLKKCLKSLKFQSIYNEKSEDSAVQRQTKLKREQTGKCCDESKVTYPANISIFPCKRENPVMMTRYRHDCEQ